jgi:hypothetical protein
MTHCKELCRLLIEEVEREKMTQRMSAIERSTLIKGLWKDFEGLFNNSQVLAQKNSHKMRKLKK